MSTSVRQFALLMGQFLESSVIRFWREPGQPDCQRSRRWLCKTVRDIQSTVTLDPLLGRTTIEGFPNDDAFNAAVVLCGMLEVLIKRALAEPNEKRVRKLEGWIFGQKAC
jgi:hypothetical protein